ncbi:MAG TPA: hypothetical protein VGR81_09515 [Candidatus Acidoferrales bacterium]|nr:hypothetical protein [Candidatus Acidoferrales bacterium]
MNPLTITNRASSEKGVALLIAIFALILISAVALSLVMMSGTGSAIDANYRNSTKAFYNAYAGLEEARGRLAPARLDTVAATLPSPLPVNGNIDVQYIVNPAPGEVVAPTNLAASNKYADNEFANEWGVPVTSGSVTVLPTVNSNSSIAGLNGPMYKWVRITGLTEKSANTDVDGNGVLDNTYPIFTDGVNQYLDTPANAGIGGNQVYRITALAVMPDNSRRMLQYDVALISGNLNFPSALTMVGPIGAFKGATSNPYQVDGVNGSGGAPAVPGCTPSSSVSLPGIGVTDPAGVNTNVNTVVSGIPSNRLTHYTGAGLPTPSVTNVTLGTTYNSPAALDQTLQVIQQNANVSLSPSAPVSGGANYSFSDITNAMPGGTWTNSSTNPQIIYVDGNFNLGPNTGSGIIVVTGNFTYSGNSGWNGIVLVVGQGTTTFLGNGGGNGAFNGALMVATTRSSTGSQLSSFGTVNFDISGGGGNGIYYNSCWVSYAQSALQKYSVLSFREVLNF